MGQTDTTAVKPLAKAMMDRNHEPPPAPPETGRAPLGPAPKGPPLFKQYKPEQGKWTRIGTFVGSGALIAWGALFLRGRLTGYEDVTAWWGLLITPGIPIAVAVVIGALAWWVSFGSRKAGDFMISTEGEIKKVSWSTRREVIGSTKVVILFTVLFAVFLFFVDLMFQSLFSWIGVLKS